MKQMMFGFLLAVQFLTRIPVPVQCPWNKKTSRWAIRDYPLVGIIIGILIAFITSLLEPYLPLPLLTLFILSLWVGLTGGLHLDGWMDVADAVGSNAQLDKKWEIMKDPHVGSFGILSLLFLLSWKALFIYYLLDTGVSIYFIIFILASSRLGAVILMITLPTAKKKGLAWEWKKNINQFDGWVSSIPVLALLFYFHEFIFLIPAYLLFLCCFGVWIKRHFRGSNGDLLGTAIEGGELWGLLIMWIYFSFVI